MSRPVGTAISVACPQCGCKFLRDGREGPYPARERLCPACHRQGAMAAPGGIGPGWWPLFRETVERLAALDPRVRVGPYDARAKAGTMELLFDPPLDVSRQTLAAMSAVARDARSRSGRLCEECGSTDVVRVGVGTGAHTVCPQHQ